MDEQLKRLKEEIKEEMKKKATDQAPEPAPKVPSKRDMAKKHRIIKGGR